MEYPDYVVSSRGWQLWNQLVTFCRLATLQWWRGQGSRAKSDLFSVSFYSKFILTSPARTHVLNCIPLKDVCRHSSVTIIIFCSPPTKVEGPFIQLPLLAHTNSPIAATLLLTILALKNHNVAHWCFLSLHNSTLVILWQALLDKAPSKRETEAQRKRTQVLARSAKSQSGSQRGKRIYYVSRGPPTTSGISRKEGKPKRVGSLEELSPATIGVPQNRNGLNSLPTNGTWNH